MHWKTKPKRELPRLGKIRHVVRFAWSSRECEDSKTVWLEKVLVKEEYSRIKMHGAGCVYMGEGWKEVQCWSQESTMWSEWNEKV